MASGFSREFWRKIMIFRKVNVFTKNILRHLKDVLVGYVDRDRLLVTFQV